MQVIHLDSHSPNTLPPHVLTIGNFDGAHLGHQAMLNVLHATAKKHALNTAVMVFEPQPREFFNPKNPPARLTNFTEKVALLDGFGVDLVICVDFNEHFRQLSATDFAGILSKLGTHHLVLGDDFRFGHDRMGDKAFLQNLGFCVQNLPTVNEAGERISSTAVREALGEGDLVKASRLLGRDYAIKGEVVHGDKIGRTLNFPTANISLCRPKPAVQGVFGADVIIHQAEQMTKLDGGIKGIRPNSLFGAVNVGMRPSVQGVDYRLEVHLPNFEGDLYGASLEVIFTHYLHGERRYGSLNELKQGISHDVAQLLAWRKSKYGSD